MIGYYGLFMHDQKWCIHTSEKFTISLQKFYNITKGNGKLNYNRKQKNPGIFKRVAIVLLAGCCFMEAAGITALTASAAAGDAIFACGDCTITYNVTGEWEQHQNIVITVTNTTDSTLYNWAIRYDAGGTISDIWNGSVIDQNNTEYVIGCQNYNCDLQPHDSITFGYTLETCEATGIPAEYQYCTETVVWEDGYDIEIRQTDAWSDGEVCEIVLTNQTEKNMIGWELAFDSNIEINSFWGANECSHSENRYEISCWNWNAVIEPLQSVIVGLISNSDTNEIPTISDVILKSTKQNYSFSQENPSKPEMHIELDGFNELGMNILRWYDDKHDTFDVYRSTDGENFKLLDSVSKTEYFIDEAIEEGTEYQYYVTAGIGTVSNPIALIAGEIPEEMPEEYPAWVDDMFLLEDDYITLHIGFAEGDNSNYVSQNLTLPENCANGSKVSWISSEPEIVRESGEVFAPYCDNFSAVTMTAVLRHGDYTAVKAFNISVAPKTVHQTVSPITVEEIISLNPVDDPAELIYSNNGDRILEINGNCAAFPVSNTQSAENALAALSGLLGISDFETEIEFDHFKTSGMLNVFYFRQIYHGIPVKNYYTMITTNAETGSVRNLRSAYAPEIESASAEPTFSAEDALAAAEEYYQTTAKAAPELMLYYISDLQNFVLIWNVTMPNGNEYVMDAVTGELLNAEEDLDEITSDTYTGYDAAVDRDVTVNVRYTKLGRFGSYDLCDLDHYFIVKNAKGHFASEETEWGSYVRSNNDWSDTRYDNALIASEYLAKTIDYYRTQYRRNSYLGNDDGLMIVGIDYYTKDDDTGAITENVNNACSGGDYLCFGSGDGTSQKSYATALDIVAHEFTHSVTRTELSLKYQGESGALSEAYSDIMGEFVDPSYDWLHGRDQYISPSETTCNRNLTSSRKYKDSGWIDTSNKDNDHGGVHSNCKVITYAAYLMSQDDDPEKYDNPISGIPKDALEQIWYNSYTQYNRKEYCNFLDCRKAVIEATKALYGNNCSYVAKVQRAFDAVDLFQHDITIKVVDAATQKPITKQTVYINFPAPIGRQPIITDGNGELKFSEMSLGEYTLSIKKDGYSDLNYTLKVVSNENFYMLEMETLYDRTLTGTIMIADDDTDPTNNLPLTKGSVWIFKESGTGKYSTPSCSLDSNGRYEFNDLPAGRYKLEIRSYKYLSTVQYITISGTGKTTRNFTVELIPEGDDTEGSASGVIRDSTTGRAVSGLTLNIYPGLYFGQDEPKQASVLSLTTDSSGQYTTGSIAAGNYTVFIRDKRPGVSNDARYVLSSFTIKVMGGKSIPNQNGFVSTKLSKNQLRIVLTWGSQPNDLDSHLYIDAVSGGNGHTWYSDKKFTNNDGVLVADLDLDDTNQYGPETTTIRNAVDGVYTFYVHDYTNRGLGISNSVLQNSNATVTVYSGYSDTPIEVYHVPDGFGTVWKVFSLNTSTGDIAVYNTISPYLPAIP